MKKMDFWYIYGLILGLGLFVVGIFFPQYDTLLSLITGGTSGWIFGEILFGD